MNIFKALGNELDYNDSIQLDGAFSVAHINYGKSPEFNKVDSKNIAIDSRKNSISIQDNVSDVIEKIYSFDGTEKDFKKEDRIALWKNYWLEYINAFDKLTEVLPNSVVTALVGRQAIELGLKYLLLKKTGNINKKHDLGNLCDSLYSEYQIEENYMEYVDTFCKKYCGYVEGEMVEYFRYPEYKENKYFSGNRLDIKWLSYNFALITLKLLHFAELENEV